MPVARWEGMRRSFASLAFLAALAAIAFGCNPTFAPPPQSTHYGAPGRAHTGQGEVVAALATGHDGNGSVALGLPLSPAARVELGADAGRSWILATAGLRLGLFDLHVDDTDLRFSGDASVGGGIGRGGELCGNQSPDDDAGCDGATESADGHAWHHRLA